MNRFTLNNKNTSYFLLNQDKIRLPGKACFFTGNLLDLRSIFNFGMEDS